MTFLCFFSPASYRATLFTLLTVCSLQANAQKPRLLYELKIYHLKNDNQKKEVEDYIQNAELPALNRQGIKPIGVFEPIDQDTDIRLYELIPYHSFGQFESEGDRLALDKDYQAKGASYLDAPYNDPAYRRVEIILLRAFPKMPEIKAPDLTASKQDRVYELRSYESSGEKFNQNKVSMFNDAGEIEIFKRLNFNAIFYAEVLSGSRMPNLMYMTSFENKADREQHWAAFGNDPEWKKISAMDKYQHNVVKADILFLRPLDFSQL